MIVFQDKLAFERAIEHTCAVMGLAYVTAPSDGRFHPTALIEGKRGNQNGRIARSPCGRFATVFNWKTGQFQTVFSAPRETFSSEQQREINAGIRAMMQAQEADRKAKQAEAAATAVERLEAAAEATINHLYLNRKQAHPHGIKVSFEALLVPVFDFAGNVTSLQTISAAGDKKFLSGGVIKGGFFFIGDVTPKLLICEGFATGSSLHQASGLGVLVAFNAGNLSAVAAGVAKQFPEAKVFLCADDDFITQGNPGRTKAKEAAASIGASVLLPRFKNRLVSQTDFNDLHCAEGLDAVRAQLAAGGAL